MLFSSSSKSLLSLTTKLSKSKISWKSPSPYNVRWQYKWKPAYYTYPKEGHEHANQKTPENSKNTVPVFWAWFADVVYRWIPAFKCVWDRRQRCFDKFNVYFLPGSSVFFYQFAHLAFGFHVINYKLEYINYRDWRARV